MALESLGTVIAVIGATISFCWGVWTWRIARLDGIAAAERARQATTESRRIEATRPFLEKQLALYSEATCVCARIASSETPDGASVARFWELYWGELALVENRDVESAMVDYGNALQFMPEDRSELRHRSLRLAAVCRTSLARSWGVEAWVAPDAASQRTSGTRD